MKIELLEQWGGVVRWAAALMVVACGFAADPPQRNWVQGIIVHIEEGYQDTGVTTSVNGAVTTRNGYRYLDYGIRTPSREYVFRIAPRGSEGKVGWLIRNTVGVGLPGGKAPEIPMTVGDPITFAVQGSKGWALDGNKKEYAATVVRQFLLRMAAPQAQPAPTNRPVPAPKVEAVDIPQSERPTLRQPEERQWTIGIILEISSPRTLPDGRRYRDYTVKTSSTRTYLLRAYGTNDLAGGGVRVAIEGRSAWLLGKSGEVACDVLGEN